MRHRVDFGGFFDPACVCEHPRTAHLVYSGGCSHVAVRDADRGVFEICDCPSFLAEGS